MLLVRFDATHTEDSASYFYSLLAQSALELLERYLSYQKSADSAQAELFAALKGVDVNGRLSSKIILNCDIHSCSL
jgi:hypothetical protein